MGIEETFWDGDTGCGTNIGITPLFGWWTIDMVSAGDISTSNETNTICTDFTGPAIIIRETIHTGVVKCTALFWFGTVGLDFTFDGGTHGR